MLPVSCNAATARMPGSDEDITCYTGTGEGIVGPNLKLPITGADQGSYSLFSTTA